jgi:hypothetical protein
MNFKTLMVIKALVCLFFGVLMLLIPGILFLIFGATLTDAGMFPAREYGSALMGIRCLCWIGRNTTDSVATKAIIVALFLYDLIAFIMTTITVIYGVLNALAWLVVIIYLFFTIGFGYYLKNPIVSNELEST